MGADKEIIRQDRGGYGETQLMKSAWDVVVIGAGIGGLSAAATLAQAKQRVLVLEKSPHPGGTAYVFFRKGFAFPMGPLGFSSPQTVRGVLTSLGVGDDLDFQCVHYRVKAWGFETTISRPFTALAADLKCHFAHDAPGIDRFFDDMAAIVGAMKDSGGFSATKDVRSFLKGMAQTAASDYLEARISDRRLRRLLGSLGTHEPYSNMVLAAAMWNLMANEGIWYPKGGLKGLCDRLVDAVSRPRSSAGAFGEVRLRAQVSRIDVTDGKVCGVILADGSRLSADTVISNADFKATFLRLLDSQVLDEEVRRSIGRAKLSGSVLQVCVGLDAGKVDLSAFSGADRLLYRRSEADGELQDPLIDWQQGRIDPLALAGEELEISLVSRLDPGLARPGGAVVVIRVPTDHSHFARYRLPGGARKPSYKSYKTMLARALLAQADRVVPGLKQAAEVIDVATPLTFEDQAARTRGAVAGWSWDYGDCMDDHAAELIRTPVSGLFMAGHQAYSTLFMGGVPTAMLSGQKAAACVLDGAGPVSTLRVPG